MAVDRGLLQRAVACDFDATPGYLIDEILRLSFVSSDYSNQMADFFVYGLKKNYRKFDPFVKLKHLKIIRRLCEDGSSAFRHNVLQHVLVLKPLISYVAPLDPLRGDAPMREVRQEAERCLKSLYGQESCSNFKPRLYSYTDHSSNISNSQIHGFGNNEKNFSTSQYVVGDGSHIQERHNKLEGFGNPYFNNNMSSNNCGSSSLSDTVAAKAEKLVTGFTQAAVAVSHYLPDNLKTKIETITKRKTLKTIPQVSMNRHCYESPSKVISAPVDFSNRFRFSNLSTPIPVPNISVEMSVNQEDLKAASHLLVEAIETACPLRNASSENNLDSFFKSVERYPEKSDVIILLISKLNQEIKRPVHLSHCILTPASTWQARVNVITAMTYLLSSSENEKRQEYKYIIEEFGTTTLNNLKISTPKCKEPIIKLERILYGNDSKQNFSIIQNNNSTSLLDLLDDSIESEPSYIDLLGNKELEQENSNILLKPNEIDIFETINEPSIQVQKNISTSSKDSWGLFAGLKVPTEEHDDDIFTSLDKSRVSETEDRSLLNKIELNNVDLLYSTFHGTGKGEEKHQQTSLFSFVK